MEWRGEGVLLSARKHGESAAIIDVLTPDRGRWTGLVHGGGSARRAPMLQPGNQLALVWRARLESHLGAFTVELAQARAAVAMADREALATLSSFCALACAFLPERDAAPAVYAAATPFLDALDDVAIRRLAYARWEITLLGDLGFGLDLSRCAATGTRDDLIYVSPRSGRAVSAAAGAPYAARLLPLPGFLRDGDIAADGAAFRDAIAMTGFFLERWAAAPLGMKTTPAARARLVQAIRDDRDDPGPDAATRS